MPRPRRPRTIGAEDHLAQRIHDEMTRRHWSNAMLAREMTEEGVTMSASSLQRSFSPRVDPESRRPIRVDELVALARVFETTVENLLAPRDWVDQEQVDKAVIDLDRADRLLVEAVQTILDAHVMLAKAFAHAPADDAEQIIDQTTTHGWAVSEYLRLIPRGATKDSTPISTQAIGRRVQALKTVIADIASQWRLREDFRAFLPASRLSTLAVIGSDQWENDQATTPTDGSQPEVPGS